MRVLHWAFPFFPGRGGQSLWIERMALAFSNQGNQVAIIAGTSVDLAEARSRLGRDVEIIQIDIESALGTKLSAAYVSRVATAIESFQPDIIHIHNLESRELVLLRFYQATIGKSVPVICTLHDLVSVQRLQKSFLTTKDLGFISAVVSPSRFIDSQFDLLDPGERSKLRIINHGVPSLKDPGFAQSGRPNLLFASDLHDHKGGVILMSAWKKLHKEFPDVTLTIAGEGPAKRFLQEYADSYGLGKQVKFMGWLTQEQLHSMLLDDCILVVPSLLGEAFGLIAAEGAMAGAALIVSRSGALPEIVEDGLSGLVVTPNDSLDLAKAIEKLLKNPELRLLLGRAGKERATSRFLLERSVSAYEKLYGEFVK